ncbi:MAG: hypothetical protein A2Z88_07425 [Omnitrophica WOR_2 bacterium GWA2_47_8]|nr:MAG: hypothetical protein A2Z88_07425 [Omnitrophica WOR_2 bacterium GWA2_47_8]
MKNPSSASHPGTISFIYTKNGKAVEAWEGQLDTLVSQERKDYFHAIITEITSRIPVALLKNMMKISPYTVITINKDSYSPIRPVIDKLASVMGFETHFDVDPIDPLLSEKVSFSRDWALFDSIVTYSLGNWRSNTLKKVILPLAKSYHLHPIVFSLEGRAVEAQNHPLRESSAETYFISILTEAQSHSASGSVAKAMGVTPQTIASMKANSLPSLSQLNAFADVMGFGIHYLVDKDEDFAKVRVPLTQEYITTRLPEPPEGRIGRPPVFEKYTPVSYPFLGLPRRALTSEEFEKHANAFMLHATALLHGKDAPDSVYDSIEANYPHIMRHFRANRRLAMEAFALAESTADPIGRTTVMASAAQCYANACDFFKASEIARIIGDERAATSHEISADHILSTLNTRLQRMASEQYRKIPLYQIHTGQIKPAGRPTRAISA